MTHPAPAYWHPAPRHHVRSMHLPDDAQPLDPKAQRAADRRRWLRAFNASLGFVLLLLVVFVLQGSVDLRAWAVQPGSMGGLRGLVGAPLLHGSFDHLAANAIALLMLGTLAAGLYPRATVRALPLAWLGSGLGAWLLGDAGSYHLGASGVTHGLMFLAFVLGLLRRDRPAIAAAMIAFFLYGGMLLTVLPQEPGVSWQAHLGGAVGGALAALLWRRTDPQAPRRRYSWEIEEEQGGDAGTARADDPLEPPSPGDVPVLWNRPRERETGTVLPFRRRE
jgi:membrane associated rhomboid family serine protease